MTYSECAELSCATLCETVDVVIRLDSTTVTPDRCAALLYRDVCVCHVVVVQV